MPTGMRIADRIAGAGRRIAWLAVATLPFAPAAAQAPGAGEAPVPEEFKVFEADLGPAWIDVSAYPPEQQQAYALFSQRCSKCHTLARPINSSLDPDQWTAYVARMSRKPGSGISPKDAETVRGFLLFDAGRRKRAAGVDPELLPFLRVSREIGGVDRLPASLRDIRPVDGSVRVRADADPRLDLSRFFTSDDGQKLVKWSRREPYRGEVVTSEQPSGGKADPGAAAAPSAAGLAAAVEDAVGSERDARERVELVLDWLDEQVKREYREGTADPAKVLADRRGDATEFTGLFVAMCRAAGVPTRARTGLVARRTAFYFQPWAQVWLDGWVDVDPYLGQFPADATHVRLEEPGGPGTGHWSADTMPGLDRLELRVDMPDPTAEAAAGKG